MMVLLVSEGPSTLIDSEEALLKANKPGKQLYGVVISSSTGTLGVLRGLKRGSNLDSAGSSYANPFRTCATLEIQPPG